MRLIKVALAICLAGESFLQFLLTVIDDAYVNFQEPMASIPLTNSAMAHLPSDKAPVLIYQTQTNFIGYLPLSVILTLPHSGKRRK